MGYLSIFILGPVKLKKALGYGSVSQRLWFYYLVTQVPVASHLR